MSPLDRHDLRDLDDVVVVLDGIKDGEGSTDVEAIDHRWVRTLKFLLVPSGKRVLCESLDLLDDDAPGLLGEFFQELPRSFLDQNGEHVLFSPVPQSPCRISSGSKATNSPVSSISATIFQSR